MYRLITFNKIQKQNPKLKKTKKKGNEDEGHVKKKKKNYHRGRNLLNHTVSRSRHATSPGVWVLQNDYAWFLFGVDSVDNVDYV